MRWILDLPDDPIAYWYTTRVAVITGRYGGGKTLLAVMWTWRALRGQRASAVVANMPLAIPGLVPVGDYRADVPDYGAVSDAVIIIDEAWQYLPSGAAFTRVREFLAYLRKRNLYLLAPSVMPVARQVRGLIVERALSLMPLGLPLWLYRWRLDAGAAVRRDTVTGWWPVTGMRDVYGMYDTAYIPGDRWFVYAYQPSQEADRTG